ncbi:hypothetical protein B0H66DRAFT_531441 [Apodospora peruviana]|uniref:Uncharacterized protein n=1 Tax=Apodospora peruviana TaxID=516989 RepID=A0AAE0IBS4_9PEZI|nr:hypothetical protein B0H66DRAFT_531441 [Apodospora peruviana]
MENRRPLSVWADAEPIEALQRAAYAMVMATESFRRQFQTPGPTRRPGVSSPRLESVAAPLLSARDAPGEVNGSNLSLNLPNTPETQRYLSHTANTSTSDLVGARPSHFLASTCLGSSATLVSPPDVTAGLHMQWPPQSFEGSPPPRHHAGEPGKPRSTHRHSSYEPGGRRCGFRRKMTLGQAVEDGNIPLMIHDLSLKQETSRSRSTRPDGFSAVGEILFVLVLYLAQMLMLGGLAQALVPAQIISQSFLDSNAGTTAWYWAAYGLTSATFVLPSGRLGDLFGHKKIFLIGCVWFAVWSLAAGFAPDVQQGVQNGNVYFCFCRAMQTIWKETESLWRQLDGYGMALCVSGLVLVNFAVNQAPIISWSTPYTYFILIIGVMLITAFVRHECLTSTHPLVPILAMKSTTNFLLGCTAAGWGCFGIWIYYTFAFLEGLRRLSPLEACLYFLPALGPGQYSYLTAALSLIRPYVGILILKLRVSQATILLSNNVSKEHKGIAASLVVSTVNYSISLALGISGTIEMRTNEDGNKPLAGFRALKRRKAEWI